MLPSVLVKSDSEIQKIIPDSFNKFLLLIITSIFFNYFAPIIIKDIWFFFVLYLYSRSRDEPFWLAYFLALNDGFFSFFGYKGVNIDSIPFLPQFEVGHLYLLVALFKTIRYRIKEPIFFSNLLIFLLLYIIYLYFYGISLGMPDDYNIHLRSLRIIFPLFLIYTTPNLLKNESGFIKFFSFVFPITILAFVSQVFSIIAGSSPMMFFGIGETEVRGIAETVIYRGFYNFSAILLAFFASLFFLAAKTRVFNRIYLQIVLISSMGTAFLSATRGWILGMSIAFILYQIIINKISVKRFLTFALPFILFLIFGLLQPKINKQLSNAFDRFLTLESVLEGDLSAGGTASRATEQGPAVLRVWDDSKLMGWGYSAIFYDNQNGHVGNENILLHSGIVGALLLFIFFTYFLLKIYSLSKSSPDSDPYKKAYPVFVLFFIALIVIHSTSGQLFGFFGTYRGMFNHAVFLGFGAIIYQRALVHKNQEKTYKRIGFEF